MQCTGCDTGVATHQCRRCRTWRCCAAEACVSRFLSSHLPTCAIGISLDNAALQQKEIAYERVSREKYQKRLQDAQSNWSWDRDDVANYPQPLSVIVGPNGVTKFTYAFQTFYLFGEEHYEKGKARSQVARSSVGYMDVELGVAGVKDSRWVETKFPEVSSSKLPITTEKWSIERFMHVLVSNRLTFDDQHPLFFYLETSVAIGGNMARFEHLPKAKGSTVKEPVLFLPQTLDRLRAMFYQGFYNRATWRPEYLEFHAVDYRSNGVGLVNAADYLCHFSVFVQLFSDRQFDTIDQLFDVTQPQWDVQLATLTLFTGTDEPAGPFYDLCQSFVDKVDKMPTIRSLDMFRSQSGYRSRVPICPQLYRNWHAVDSKIAGKWHTHVEDKILAYNIAQRYHEFREHPTMDTYVDLSDTIADAHMWYMDSPMLCTMMANAHRCKRAGLLNTIHLGYFGAQHVSNLIPFLHHLDAGFITDQGGTGKVSPIAEIRHGLLSALAAKPAARIIDVSDEDV